MNWSRKQTEWETKTDAEIAELKKQVADLKLTVDDLSKSVESLIGALKPVDEEDTKEATVIKTPKPRTWSEKRNALIASRQRPDFVQKVLDSNTEAAPLTKVNTTVNS